MASYTYPPMIDIGINLCDPQFRGVYRGRRKHDDDFAEVLDRAWAHGVSGMIITGTNLKESHEAVALADTDARLFCTVGVHPTRAGEFDKSSEGSAEAHLAALLALVEANTVREGGSVVAIGECGLDYDRTKFCKPATQRKYFDLQFELAEKTGLPMFLHDRNTGGDFAAAMRGNRDRISGGVVHSFTGTMEEAQAYIDMGLFIGINGCSLKTEANLEVVAQIPVESMMIETDGPWCGIRRTHAGHGFIQTEIPCKKVKAFEMGMAVKDRCEPAHLPQVLEVVHAVRDRAGVGGGETVEELGQRVYQNTVQLFQLPSAV